MKKILCLVYCGLALNLSAQSPQQELQQIVYQISRQFGADLKPPNVVLEANKAIPALYIRTHLPKITLDTQLYDTLKTALGKSKAKVAMAFILGHELVHHFHRHQGGSFSFGVNSSHCDKEIEADIWGSYYAQLAGYTIDTATYAHTLRTIYQKYRVKDTPENCLSLQQRVDTTQTMIEYIQHYQIPEVFQAAKLFFGLSHHYEASLFLEFIFGKGFKSTPVRNNLAVTYLKQYVDSLPKVAKFFKYPFEYDLHSGVRASDRQFKQVHLLNRAEQLLNQIIRQNRHAVTPAYINAYTNKACLNILQKKYATAVETIQEIKQHQPTLPANAQATQAIAYAWLNNGAKARESFQKSAASEVSRFNQMLYQRVSTRQPANFKQARDSWLAYKLEILIDSIQAVFFKPMANDLDPEAEQRVFRYSILSKKKLKKWVVVSPSPVKETDPPYLEVARLQDYPTLKHWRIKKAVKKGNTKRYASFYLFSTKPGFRQASARGIRIGDSVDKLLRIYKHPQMLTDRLYLYNGGNIFFEVSNKKVIGWTVWKQL